MLIVEDEPLIAMVLADYLQDAGCTPLGPAQSVAKALNMIAGAEIDAALVDGNLAGQLVGDVAAELLARNIPFAFVTGYGREALPLGFQDWMMVEKPFSQQQIIAALENILNDAAVRKVPA